MAIGYIGNLANVQAGNQQVINSLAGLGQQIAGAINTHAATQSAQAMLPMLQQQYTQGLQKVAAGDSAGLADVYQASMIASQNPLLAPMASHAVNLANQANIQAQHGLRTLAAHQGALMRAGIKANGSAGLIRPMTAGQQAQNTYRYRGQLNNLWNNNKTGIDDFLSGKTSDSSTALGQALNNYQQIKQDSGVVDPNFENLLAAKQAIQANAPREKVLERYKALQSASPKTSTPSITSPAQVPSVPRQAPVPLPSGLQINPSFNSGAAAPAGGSMIPAASGALGGGVAEAEEPESDLQDQTEDQTAETATV